LQKQFLKLSDTTKLTSDFQIKEILGERNIININQLSNGIRKVLNKKVNSVDYPKLYEEIDKISDSEHELGVID